jgi:hypothetical protein
MADLRSESLARIGVSQSELDSIRTAMTHFDELYRDLYDVGEALEKRCSSESANGSTTVVDLELKRLERELEYDVRQCLKSVALPR